MHSPGEAGLAPVRFQNGKLVAGAKGSCTPKYLRSMLIVGSTEFNFKPTTKKKKNHIGYFLISGCGEGEGRGIIKNKWRAVMMK